MAYPSTLDSFSNPNANDRLNSPAHHTIETNQNTALAAVETKVGVDSSAVATTIDYLLKNTASVNPGHKHTLTGTGFTDVAITSIANRNLLAYDTSVNKWVNIAGSGRFGGTGADGILTIVSGSTNIDCLGAALVIKNYTSIEISGTGSLTFSNPHANGTVIVLKSQGNVTLTSSTAPFIDLRNFGATGGAGFSGANGAGTRGSNGFSTVGFVQGGTGGTGDGSASTGAAGVSPYSSLQNTLYSKIVPLFVGSGGGGGGTSTGSAGGTGGRGAGGMYIECGGAFNFTTASGVNIAGTVGTNGSGGSNSEGGGGGSGGMFLVLYNTLTAASGTVTTTGGAGGTGVGTGKGGGGGANLLSGVAGTSGSGTGATGNVGLSLMVANTEFF